MALGAEVKGDCGLSTWRGRQIRLKDDNVVVLETDSTRSKNSAFDMAWAQVRTWARRVAKVATMARLG